MATKTPRRTKLLIDLAMLALCVGIALTLTRPWIAHPLTTSIGFSNEKYDGLPLCDIMLSVGFSGWLKFAPAQLHQWPLAHTTYLMYPLGASHGTSFDGLLSGAVTAALWTVMPLLLAHDLAMLLGLVLGGFVVWRLGVRLWGRGLAAGAVAVSAECMPYLMQRIGTHPNLVYIWTVPLALHLFFNLQRKPTWKRTVAWSASFALLAASSWYILIMGLAAQACLTAGALAAEWPGWGRWRGGRQSIMSTSTKGTGGRLILAASGRSGLLLRLAAGWAGGMALIVVLGWPMITNFHGRAKIETDALAAFSVPLVQFVMPFPGGVIGNQPWAMAAQRRIGSDWEAFAGGPIAALVLMLLYFGWPRPGGPRLALALTALAAFFLCLGPYLSVTHLLPAGQGLRLPLYYLGRLTHAFNVVRIPGRMHPLLNYAALLASGALLAHWRRGWFSRGRLRRRLAWPALIGAYLALNIVWSIDLRPYRVFQNVPVPRFYRELGARPGPGAVLDVPISYYQFPYYNYYQFFHKRPTVSPVLFHDAVPAAARMFIWRSPALPFFMDTNRTHVRPEVIEQLVRPGVLADLSRAGVEFVVVHEHFLRAICESGQAHEQTRACYDVIEKAWAPRRVYQDAWIRVYKTDPALPLVDVLPSPARP